jgi:hypothetical protein
MSITALTPPQDITWTRLAFSRDMIDTNFGDLAFSPKWRSSLAVYFYIVPEEETADAYLNSRIVYLKLTCSITGWNPSEGLHAVKKEAEEADQLDDLQRSLWDVITSSGWVSTYWPCWGAIMQIAVYPRNPDGVAPDDYPYILDFEPKKRELFESVTEGSEVLSGTTDATSITKGSTSVRSTEYGGGGSFGIGSIGASASFSKTKSDTTIDQKTTDTSREARETLSRTTTSSQMYQLFNGYHLGTNRAVFVVQPRPHTVTSSDQIEGSLINGERKLEGLQDVFLVVHMPRSLDGFCIQAGLDTGHLATVTVPKHNVVFLDQSIGPVDPNHFPDTILPPETSEPPVPPSEDPEVKQLVITRRIVQSCGIFDENGNLKIQPVPERRSPEVVGEIALPDLPTRVLFRAANGESKNSRINLANNLNMLQGRVNRLILDSASSANYQPRNFEQTSVFKSLVSHSLATSNIPLSRLASKGYISRSMLGLLNRQKITTVGDLFSSSLVGTAVADSGAIKIGVIDKLLKVSYK